LLIGERDDGLSAAFDAGLHLRAAVDALPDDAAGPRGGRVAEGGTGAGILVSVSGVGAMIGSLIIASMPGQNRRQLLA